MASDEAVHVRRTEEVVVASPNVKRAGTTIRLDASGLLRELLAGAAAISERALGPEMASAYLTAVGRLVAGKVEQLYRDAWGVRRPFTPEEYARLVVDLKKRMGEEFFLSSVSGEKVVIHGSQCPFRDLVRTTPQLCLVTGSLLGDLAVRNFGYAKVARRRCIGAGDPGCEVAIHLAGSHESVAEEGMEFRDPACPASDAEPGRGDVADRSSLLGQGLRDALLARNVATDRWRLLSKAGRLFCSEVEAGGLLGQVAALAAEELGGLCVVYRGPCEGSDAVEIVDVHHRDPAVARAVRDVLATSGWTKEGLVYNALAHGRPLLIPDLSGEHGEADRQTTGALAGLGLRSLLVAHLSSEGRPPASLLCMSGPEKVLDERDLSLALSFVELASVAIENARKQAEMKRAVESRDMFISVASHELRNALTSLRSLVQITLRGLQKETTASAGRTEQHLQLVLRQTDRLVDLTRDLLDVARIESGGMQLRREPTSLNSVVVGVAERFQGVVGEHTKHQLVIEMPRRQVVGMWDRDRIDQVLTNLLANAIKYSPDGGMLRVRVEQQGGSGSASETDGGCEPPVALVAVADQGPGIPRDQQESIFEPFKRGLDATEGREGGLGLGLHICKGIVEAHGGKMWVESRVGCGSTFYFTLPLENVGQ